VSASMTTTTTSTDKGKNTLSLQPNSNSGKGTWVHELFEGTLTSETRCLTCETVSPDHSRLYIYIYLNTSLGLFTL
jgi:hypothetical protein